MRTSPLKINKLALIGYWLLLFTSYGFSQETARIEDSLYYKALFASLDEMAKSWGKIDNSLGGSRDRTDYFNRIVQKTDITQNLPAQLGEYRVEYLDDQGLIDRSKKVRKPFAVLTGSPMIDEGERLRIRFVVSYIQAIGKYKKKILHFALSDWSDVYFRYDCEKRKYVVDEVKLGGI